jgi:hypothetical protein
MNLHNALHGWLELANTSSLEEKIWEKRYFTKLNYDIEIYEEIQSPRVDCIAVSSIVSIEPDASSLKCFLIITHQKIYELRADSEVTAKNWVFALRDWKNFIEKYQGLFITDNEKEV